MCPAGVSLGQSAKAQLALRRACAVAARHADCVRDAWRHLLEMLHTLYIGRLLPKVGLHNKRTIREIGDGQN